MMFYRPDFETVQKFSARWAQTMKAVLSKPQIERPRGEPIGSAAVRKLHQTITGLDKAFCLYARPPMNNRQSNTHRSSVDSSHGLHCAKFARRARGTSDCGGEHRSGGLADAVLGYSARTGVKGADCLSLPGLLRQSISSADSFKRWMRGSSPRMTIVSWCLTRSSARRGRRLRCWP